MVTNMYEPKLPVSGYSFAVLAFTPFLSNIAILLLAVTFLLVLFRFTRLLYKEKNLLNALLVIITLVVGVFLSVFIYRLICNEQDNFSINNIKPSNSIVVENKLNYNSNVIDESNIFDDSMIYNSSFSYGENIGVLSIDSISLNLDVLEDASDENMFIGACHVLYTPYPWENGNSFIASHNVKNYGLLFDRLHEVKIGDTVSFTSPYGDIYYEVYDIDIVDGDDTSCFNKLKGARNLSLVTCSNKKRLIVYCKEFSH